MKRLVLVGGGHAHLFVLQRLAEAMLDDVEVTLVAPGRWQIYSGMLPGWMAGHYAQEDIRLDLRNLADHAGVRFIEARMVALDADRRCLRLSDGAELFYDLLSLDIGSQSRRDRLEAAGPRLLTIKPLDAFHERWRDIVDIAAARKTYSLVVVGGGAAGVELALSAKYALTKICPAANVRIVTGTTGFLRGHANGVRRRAKRALETAGIEILAQRATGTGDGVMLGSGESLGADTVLAATGAAAPALLAGSGLALDQDGFIRVDACHRSLSHPEVFAAGDVCARDDPPLQRSGVHAVRAGPVLAENLLAALDGRPLQTYRPRKNVLYLLACGDRYAIASWGPFSVEGRWVWRWKDHIDRRFIARFSP